MKRLLLLSNSTNFGSAYLDHAMEAILRFLGPARRLAFVPFALEDQARYAGRVRERFEREGVDVVRVTEDGGAAVLESAGAVFVGGGNTFRLLGLLRSTGVLDALRRLGAHGMPYLGSSAGTNIAAPTIKTTNDMPIVDPRGFEALGLVPFQINPHYIDPDDGSRHMGETREERLREYLEENETPVIGLREGSWLHLEGASLRLEGATPARVFRRGELPQEISPGSALDWLLEG